MFEVLSGAGLAAAAGLNAYVPLLVLGLLSRFTDLVSLPTGWSWLENGWVQVIRFAWVPIVLGILLALTVHVDKTVVGPAANVATANVATAGIAAPVLSTIEDAFSVVMSFVALLLPVLVILGLAGLVVGAVSLIRRMRHRRLDAPPVLRTGTRRPGT